MKEKIKNLIIGCLVGVILTSGVVYSKSGNETITAIYNNIKIYIDGLKIEPTDANGKTVEPFIYNGTTYLPVRAIGEAIGKTVHWDGATQSVYLGEKPGEVQYLTDVCPAFQFDERHYKDCTTQNGKFFEMGGKKYTNGFYATAITDINGNCGNSIFFNLNGKYKSMSFLTGAVDNELSHDSQFRIYADGNLIKTIDVKIGELPQKHVLDINHALQIRIDACAGINWASVGSIGMAEITLN